MEKIIKDEYGYLYRGIVMETLKEVENVKYIVLVTSTASEVRPWKALATDSTRLRPFLNEASFKAFSLASAPELMRKR